MSQRPVQRALVVAALFWGALAFPVTVTLHAASVALPGAAQGVKSVPVSIQPPSAVDIVLFSSGAAGKTLTTTDRSGRGSIDGSSLASLGRLAMIEETCPSRNRLLLVAPNGKPPDGGECVRRSIGSFDAGKDTTLKAELSLRDFTPVVKAEPIPVSSSSPPAVRPSAPEEPPPKPRLFARQPRVVPVAHVRPARRWWVQSSTLQPGGDSFEKAPLLSPCVYRGVEDTDRKLWKFYKLQVDMGQTLKVTVRLRDLELPSKGFGDAWLYVRLHGPNGGVVGNGCEISRSERDVRAELQGRRVRVCVCQCELDRARRGLPVLRSVTRGSAAWA